MICGLDGDVEWRDWVHLGLDLDSAQCEKLCKEYRENGCCYLGTYPGYVAVIGGLGCYWRPGGYSIKSGSDPDGMSVNVYRSGRKKHMLLGSNWRIIYIGPSSTLMQIYFHS